MLGNKHVLRTRGWSSRHAAGRHQVPHRLLPVGAGDVAYPGVLLLRSVPRLAHFQRTLWNQYQQPRRGCRHHPERTVSRTAGKDHQVTRFMTAGISITIDRTNERTNEVYLPVNGVNNDWLPVEAEARQSWPPKKKLTN